MGGGMWGSIGLVLAVLTLQVDAGEYGHYRLEQLVSIDKGQATNRIDLTYLDPWLVELVARSRESASGLIKQDERQRLMADVQALESIVGLAVLEQGTAALLKRSALLATVGYQLGLQGAAERAESAFNRWLLLTPNEGDVHYQYGNFLLLSGHDKRAAFYLDKAFRQGMLDAELLLAMALQRSGEPRQADEHLRHFRLTHPNHPPIDTFVTQGVVLPLIPLESGAL